MHDLWEASLPEGVKVSVHHRKPYKSIEAATAYMYKYATHYTPVLPLKGSIDVTWGTKKFFGEGGKKARWEGAKFRLFGGPSDPDFFAEHSSTYIWELRTRHSRNRPRN